MSQKMSLHELESSKRIYFGSMEINAKCVREKW